MDKHFVDEQRMREYAKKYCNWGKWGEDDQKGTLNFVGPEEIKYAASLAKKGKVFSLGLEFHTNGPQNPARTGRPNPIHTMLAAGVDYLPQKTQKKPVIFYADDMITMPLQCATHWDSLAHVFYQDENGGYTMYNGFGIENTNVLQRCVKCGIENYRDKMFGRGVLLDMARYKGVDCLQPEEGITIEDLDGCAKKQNVEIRKGDFILIRTGFMGSRENDRWSDFVGSDAPGVEFETLEWIYEKQIAAIAMDTWCVEVKPGRSDLFQQPWHWIAIPMIGLAIGEMFRLDELGADCAEDGVYDFIFTAPSIVVTGGTGGPLNPLVIK